LRARFSSRFESTFREINKTGSSKKQTRIHKAPSNEQVEKAFEGNGEAEQKAKEEGVE
jgi:hypothetical protein